MSHRTVTLGSIAKITSGGTPERTKPEYWNGTIPWVKTAQIQNGTITADDIDEWITPIGLEQSSARMIPKGTILMAMYGQGKTRGQVAILGLDAAINQACAAIQLGEGVNRDYVFQQLQYRYDAIRAMSNTGSQENLNAELIREIAFPLPPVEIQREIAQALDAWDAAIQKTEQLIAAKERHYTHELSRLISRGHHPRSHVGSFAYEISKRNRGGRPALLGDFLTESREPATDQDPARRLTVRLHLQGVEARPVRGTESDGATTYFRRRAGQLIYGKQNIFRGAIGIVPPELDGYASTQDLPAFDIADGIDPQWLYFWLSRKDFYTSLEALAAGSGSKRLHPEEFFKVRVYLPDLATQTAIARYLNALREEIALLGQSLAALKRQKRGLMQKLLTGQWRLPVPGQEIA